MDISLYSSVNHSISENKHERGLIAGPIPRYVKATDHAPAVDHILDTLVVPAGTRAARPEPEPCAGQRLGAQVLGKVQIRNAKEVFWEIVSVDQHGTAIIQRRKAGNKRPGSVNQCQRLSG
jgi:hypothetical protein